MPLAPTAGRTPAPMVAAWCARHLGSPAVEQFLGIRRLSAVHGVRLGDGREVVVKVREALPRQRACALVQEALWQRGIPCPRPLAGPAPLVEGRHPVMLEGHQGDPPVDARSLSASAETWEGVGRHSDGGLGPDGFARLLATIISGSPPVTALPSLEPPVPWLWWDHRAPGRTWPPPASERWDPHRVDRAIPAIVHEVARRSRARLLRPDVARLPLVVGHGDFEPQNCRWVEEPGRPGRLVVHDWDSVVALPEAALAGNAAVTYLPDPERPQGPGVEQNEHFLDAYADARGRALSTLERQVAHATGAWVVAYTSAFEHLKDGPGPSTAVLLEEGERRLALAGCAP